MARLRGAGLAASVVNSVADLVREPHCWSRGDLLRLTHPALGEIVTQGIVPALSRTPGRVAGWSTRPGSDTEAVLRELLGFTPEQIRELGPPRLRHDPARRAHLAGGAPAGPRRARR